MVIVRGLERARRVAAVRAACARRLRQKNEPDARFGRIPKPFHVSQRNWLYVDFERQLCGCPEELRKRLKDRIYRRTPETASKKLKPGAADVGDFLAEAQIMKKLR